MSDPIVNPGSIGPTAHHVVDGSTYHIAVDLEPILVSLLPDIARAIVRNHCVGSLHFIGKAEPSDPSYALALGYVTDAVRGVLTVQLHPDAAERLSGELEAAIPEPATCRCGDYTENADSVCDPCREPGSYARRRSL